MCNDKSIGAVTKYMGWKTPGPLPVKLCVPMHTGRGVTSHAVDAELLDSDRFAELTAGLDDFPVEQWTNSYTTEYLRWRLACPSTRYALHASDDLVAVTTTDTRFGVRAVVLLKLLVRGRRSRRVAERAIAARVPLPPRARTRCTPASTLECTSAGSNRPASCSRRRST